MKQVLSIVGILALLAGLLSCAGFPEPAAESNSLVIGSLILDFPDGFFDRPPMTFERDVRVSFRNVTQDKTFNIFTNRGYFYFQTNGADQYVLESFEILNVTIGDSRYSFGKQTVNFKISNSPNKVIYLGHLVFTFSAPAAATRSGGTTYYNYDSSVKVDWKKESVQQYITDKQADSSWLDREIVEYGKK